MTAVTDFQYGMKERDEVAVVKLHAKMCQGLKEIEALTAGAQVLTCVGETEDGGGEELHEWRELLQNNNEHRQELHEEVGIQRRKELNEAAGQGMVYAVGISAAYTTSKAAVHVAREMIRWRAKTLESKDTDIIPDTVGYVTAVGVVDAQNNSYPIPPEHRTDEQVQELISNWLEDGLLSLVPRRDRALLRGNDGRRVRDSKEAPWTVTIQCASRKIANKVISTIKVAELPPYLSTKVRGSVRKWRPDRATGGEKEKKRKHGGQQAAAVMAPNSTGKNRPGTTTPGTPPGSGNGQRGGSWKPPTEAKNRMAQMLDNAKSRLRNDSAERTRVERTMNQMNMTPSEQQAMEIAAAALAMESIYKDGSSKGVWTRDINKNMAESVKELMQKYRYLNR
jgi:hypothetical protein